MRKRRKPRRRPPMFDLQVMARAIRPPRFGRVGHAERSIRHYEAMLEHATTAKDAARARDAAEVWRGILAEARAA